ncbi:MAG: UDP-N-acetylmuramoyl-L-alanyl-D-glutamate--2,6-diaminopimelate ligase [Candidatus Brocadiia bacterium]
MTLNELIRSMQIVQKVNYSDMPVRTVTDDSRDVQPGAVFVAVDGEEVDGHGFVREAMDRGAAAIICERLPVDEPTCPVLQVKNSRQALSHVAASFYGRPADQMRCIGVTGTDGKTTTTELIHAILEEDQRSSGCLTTVRSEVGGQERDSSQTTPHPLDMHRMLREMADEGQSHACMEVSSHALVHRRTAHVPFDTAVLTNVTQDHLDFHGSLENYIGAKEILFNELDSESVAVLNAECPHWWRYSNATPANVLTYGRRSLADVRLVDNRNTIRGTRLTVRTPLDKFTVFSPLVGDYNCENVLAAVTAAFGMGIPAESIVRAIENFEGVGGRLEKIAAPSWSDLPTVFVDYAHTPNALEKVLRNLQPLTQGRLICVFGCGGDRDRDKRPKMGNAVTEIADLAVITADNSRSERTEDIIEEIVAGVDQDGATYHAEPDRRRAIEYALRASDSPEDVVAVCGRGCEQFQQLGERKIPFDDRVVIREMMDRAAGEQKRSA